jgi:hypothetical protein
LAHHWEIPFTNVEEERRQSRFDESLMRSSRPGSAIIQLDSSSMEMRGTTAPLEQIQLRVQHPLPSDDDKVILPKIMFPKIDIPARVQVLENLFSSEHFKLNTWVKLARKKGIPYFEPPVKIDPGPIESIEYSVLKPFSLCPQADTFAVEKARLGKYWDDSFKWDLVSRKVAEVRKTIEDPRSNSSQKTQYWKSIMGTEFKSIVQRRIGKEMTALVRQLQRKEWDQVIIPSLNRERLRNPNYDYQLTMMTFYNPELPAEEKNRRLNMLDPNVVRDVVQFGKSGCSPRGHKSLARCHRSCCSRCIIPYEGAIGPQLPTPPSCH